MSKKKSKVAMVDLPVEFGGVSIGEQTARLGCRFSKSLFNDLNRAADMFVGRRLDCRVGLGGEQDSPGQTMLFDDMEVFVEATADCKRLGLSTDTISIGLTFNLKDVDIETLARFSKGSGRLAVDQVAQIPVDTVSSDDDDDDDAKPTGALKTDKPWKSVQLDTLFHGGILKALKGAGLSTVGDLAGWTVPDKNGYSKSLTDIKGIGKEKAEAVENRLLQFWSDNPGAGSEHADAEAG
jgi:hypothetical protein